MKDIDDVLGGPRAWENAQITEERWGILFVLLIYKLRLRVSSTSFTLGYMR